MSVKLNPGPRGKSILGRKGEENVVKRIKRKVAPESREVGARSIPIGIVGGPCHGKNEENRT